MNIHHILVPVDFSGCTLGLVREAAELGQQCGARLTLLHVATLPEGLAPDAHLHPAGGDVTAAEYVAGDARIALAPYAQAAAALGVPTAAVVQGGAVVPGILAASQRLGADLVMMGTHGRTGLARALLGSVAEQVVRASSVPVLLVRRERRPTCAAASCAWCALDGLSRAEAQALAEAEG